MQPINACPTIWARPVTDDQDQKTVRHWNLQKNNTMKILIIRIAGLLLAAILVPTCEAAMSNHVLVISIDGMHALDLALFVKNYTNSTLARLTRAGFNYTSASTPKPSDSLPGNLALCTGGSPLSTGVFYDRSYDRTYVPAGYVSGPTGTAVIYDESADLNSSALDGGGGLNTNAL